MGQQRWDHSVTIEGAKPPRLVTITSTERAAEFMLFEWSGKRGGKAFKAAKQSLINARDGKVSIDAARTAFLAAAEEAGIFFRQ
ncbi:DUF982 domain-containing protein [Rhizobium calliandrae]|uniref:DUF982 domain-containing protein n=1 Tax=Rhizobium calliandrae TaxID=1312182 RepID=A0ABT7KKX6_9HYPH|nr:DUF982 domain-containing protein [Rhizobium calliandrae]MDL2409270.1 DUF982 domain-containing protein [Rhizobium calliandrae]